jgi:TonB family protein
MRGSTNVVFLGFTLVLAAVARSQTIGGRLVDKANGRPIQSALVSLRDSASKTVATARTDTTGTFYVDASGPGAFTLEFSVDSISLGASDVVRLAAGEFHQEVYAVAIAHDRVYLESEVTKPVRPYGGNRFPQIPVSEARSAGQGKVVVEYVVDTTGHIEMATFAVKRETNSEFLRAVRSAAMSWRFEPAILDNRHVRQLVHSDYEFKVETGTTVVQVPSRPPR